MKQHILTAIIFIFHNNSFKITDALLFKVAVFNASWFDIALFDLAIFDAALFDVDLF